MNLGLISGLRSVALNVPDLERALDFYTEVWRLSLASRTKEVVYLRGGGGDHHVLALHAGTGATTIRHITLRARSHDALHAIAKRAVLAGGVVSRRVAPLAEPSGGDGVHIRDHSGRVFEVVHKDLLHATASVDPDCPLRLAHVVLNCRAPADAERFIEQAFGFALSDRTRIMAFMNCNRDHHTLALSPADNDALNHIAFLMPTLDAVMRGAGRMRDHGYPIEWGPGRHGPGNNAFSYFVDPFGVVVEYTAEVAQIDDSHRPRGPSDWSWPPGRVDQWGIGIGPTQRLKEAQQQVFFEPSHASDA